MIKQKLEFKQQVIGKFLKSKLSVKEAADLLGCKRLTIYRYINKVTKGGLDALKDGRHSNNYKLTSQELSKVLTFKRKGHWRSARKVLEITDISSVTPRRVRQIWVEYGLNKLNVERLKPITRENILQISTEGLININCPFSCISLDFSKLYQLRFPITRATLKLLMSTTPMSPGTLDGISSENGKVEPLLFLAYLVFE